MTGMVIRTRDLPTKNPTTETAPTVGGFQLRPPPPRVAPAKDYTRFLGTGTGTAPLQVALKAPDAQRITQVDSGFRVPDNFQLRERFVSLTTAMDVTANGRRLGTVSAKWLSLTPSFTLRDSTGRVVATARQRLFSWGTQIDVKDASGRSLGSIKEHVFESLFKFRTVYSVQDSQGREVAESTKVEAFSTEMTVRADGREVASMRRPWLRLTDRWDVNVEDQDAIDPRMLVMMTAYKTLADNRREQGYK